jgi:ribosomal protein S18 acetylase RimI-like enzyme
MKVRVDDSLDVAIVRDGDRVVGMARLLSDGVCNAYLLDVWTLSSHRGQGIGAAMVRQLMSRRDRRGRAGPPRRRTCARSPAAMSPRLRKFD